MGAYTEYYCVSGGNNLNAGTLNGTTEPSTTALATYSGGTWVNSTRVFTVASGNPVTDGVLVDQFAAINNGGTTPNYVARITAVTSTTITLAASGFGTNPADGTYQLRVGGALAGPNGTVGWPFGITNGGAGSKNTSGHQERFNFKNSAVFSVTAAVTHNLNNNLRFEGYTSTPGDGGLFILRGPTTGTTFNLLTVGGDGTFLEGCHADRNGDSGGTANSSGYGIQVLSGSRVTVRRCFATNMRRGGFWMNASVRLEYCCAAYNGADAGFWCGNVAPQLHRCASYLNTGHGLAGTFGTNTHLLAAVECISFRNTLAGFDFSTDTGGRYYGCVAYRNGTAGFTSGTGRGAVFENCASFRNGTFGLVLAGSNNLLRNFAFGQGTNAGNTSGAISGSTAIYDEVGRINYTSGELPWIDPDNGDFRLKTTDTLMYGAGFGTWFTPDAGFAGTVGYPDVGAAQRQQSAGGTQTVLIAPKRTVR